jgi:hypothetical protein
MPRQVRGWCYLIAVLATAATAGIVAAPLAVADCAETGAITVCGQGAVQGSGQGEAQSSGQGESRSSGQGEVRSSGQGEVRSGEKASPGIVSGPVFPYPCDDDYYCTDGVSLLDNSGTS